MILITRVHRGNRSRSSDSFVQTARHTTMNFAIVDDSYGWVVAELWKCLGTASFDVFISTSVSSKCHLQMRGAREFWGPYFTKLCYATLSAFYFEWGRFRTLRTRSPNDAVRRLDVLADQWNFLWLPAPGLQIPKPTAFEPTNISKYTILMVSH